MPFILKKRASLMTGSKFRTNAVEKWPKGLCFTAPCDSRFGQNIPDSGRKRPWLHCIVSIWFSERTPKVYIKYIYQKQNMHAPRTQQSTIFWGWPERLSFWSENKYKYGAPFWVLDIYAYIYIYDIYSHFCTWKFFAPENGCSGDDRPAYFQGLC